MVTLEQQEAFLPDVAVREIFAQSIYTSFRPSFPYRDTLKRWFFLFLITNNHDDDRSTF